MIEDIEDTLLVHNNNKDYVDMKSCTKKSPLTYGMVVLFITAVCGMYICSINLEHPARVIIRPNTKLLELSSKVNNNNNYSSSSCYPNGVEEWELPYLHYPQPKAYNREECACNPVRFFVILSMQRSGSGWFETFLNSHGNVSSNGEIFALAKSRENVSLILKTMDTLYNLDLFTSASKNECTSALGFKWMLNQGLMENHEEIMKYFERRKISIIFLFRRNLLRRMVSVLANIYDKDAKPLNGTHKSHVHSPLEAKILSKYKPWINTTLLESELRETEETASKAIEYFNNTHHIVLYYEDLLKNLTKLNDAQEFLRVPYRDLHSRQMKIHTAPLPEQIENWEQVQEALKGTQYHAFLSSD